MKLEDRKKLGLEDAIRVTAAETWLAMGRPDRALRELQQVTSAAREHPWTERVVWRAAQALE